MRLESDHVGRTGLTLMAGVHVRVEAPMRLAEWVLADAGGWTEERLVASTAAGPPREAALVHPVRIAIVYLTAAASPDGVVRFADDLYGHDAILDQALHRFAATEGAAAERTGERLEDALRGRRALPVRRSDHQVRTRPVSTCTNIDAG